VLGVTIIRIAQLLWQHLLGGLALGVALIGQFSVWTH
jgi:hypothetical protein